MPLTVKVEPERLMENQADDRGRVTLGSESAGQSVKNLIVTDPDADEEPNQED